MSDLRTFDGIKLTAGREVVERTRRDKSFLISTLVTLGILCAIIFLPKLFGADDPKEFDVGLVGAASQPLGPALTAQGEAVDIRINTSQPASAAEAEAAARDGSLDLAVVDGRELVAKAEVDEQLNLLVQAASRAGPSRRSRPLGSRRTRSRPPWPRRRCPRAAWSRSTRTPSPSGPSPPWPCSSSTGS